MNDDSYPQKLQPGKEVSDVTAQGLEAGVGALGPLIRDFPHKQVASYGLQISIHDHQAFDGLEKVLKAQSDGAQQPRKEEVCFLAVKCIQSWLITGCVTKEMRLFIQNEILLIFINYKEINSHVRVVALHLLDKHSVHTFLIKDREFGKGSLNVKVCGKLEETE